MDGKKREKPGVRVMKTDAESIVKVCARLLVPQNPGHSRTRQ
jgi:hypothetical protein